MKSRCREFIELGAALALLFLAAAALVPGAVWITDNGNKYIQMRNFASGGGHLIRHPQPELFPAGGFHFFREPGGAKSFYPEYLSVATVPFYRLFGERGVLFWPVLATLLTLFLAGRALKLSPLVLLVGTPLLFYSLLLWEMTPSVCLVLISLIFCRRRYFFAGGVLLGASLLMREEAYFAAAALGAALVFCGRWKECIRLAAGFLCPALPIWFYQFLIYGHILGLHGSRYLVNNNESFSVVKQAGAAFFNYSHHLFRFDGWGGSWRSCLAWSGLLPLIAGAAPDFRSWLKFKYIALGVYFLCMGILAVGLWFQPVPVYAAAGAVGLFTVTPLMAGGMVNWRALLKTRRYRLWLLTALFYIIGVPPLLTASDVGLVWGARHFLVFMPLFCYLSFCGFRRMMPVSWSRMGKRHYWFGIALCVSILIQGYGFYALARVSRDSSDAERKMIRAPGKILVTDVFYLPEQTPRVFFEKTVLQVITFRDLALLRSYLAAKGEDGFALVLSPRFRRMSDPVLRGLLTSFPLIAPPERFTGKGGFPDLFVGSCRMARSSSGTASPRRVD